MRSAPRIELVEPAAITDLAAAGVRATERALDVRSRVARRRAGIDAAFIGKDFRPGFGQQVEKADGDLPMSGEILGHQIGDAGKIQPSVRPDR